MKGRLESEELGRKRKDIALKKPFGKGKEEEKSSWWIC